MGAQICVVDYRKGNLRSVVRGLERVGAEAFSSVEAADIERASAVVLPGVGAFADAARALEETGQMEALRRALASDVPFLGICLGLHLLYEEGVEGAPEGETVRGIGALPGCVDRLPRLSEAGESFKVPHVGWNTVEQVASSELFAGIDEGAFFYFTHSFAAPCGAQDLGRTRHSVLFPSVQQAGPAAFGVQFHPEKSSDVGSVLLQNFVRMAKAG